jgi:hypothetical protein
VSNGGANEKRLQIAKVFLALVIFPAIFFPMSNSFTQTENHENFAADAAQWAAESAMSADAAREDGREAMEEAGRDAEENAGRED